MTLTPGSRHGRGCFVDIDISIFLFFIVVYFYVLAARALSLAPREDWTLINLSHARWRGGWRRQFLSFFAFCRKDSLYFVAGKTVFVLPVLSEAISG